MTKPAPESKPAFWRSSLAATLTELGCTTAGLDPEERLRFYRVLSEMAADRTVILSTHIVEDVAVLCPRFAVIREGRLVAVTSPGEARSWIAGSIFEGSVEPEAYEAVRQGHCVTQAYLVEGRNRVRVYDPDGNPPPGFVPVAGTLEDAYLVLMRGGRLDRLPGLDALAEPTGVAR